MTQKKPAREMNDSSGTAYRAEDAARVPGAEAGFDMEGRGLHYVDQTDATTGYKKAQKTPTYAYPQDDQVSPR